MSFIIRVYGIYLDKERGLFVSDEIVRGKYVTKFPGGGLEYGEGTIECLKREMLEETNTEFEILSHFYTTDFFLESAFHDHKQLISIYYMIAPKGNLKIEISHEPFAFKSTEEGSQSFRFIGKQQVNEDEFTFPIDSQVIKMLRNSW